MVTQASETNGQVQTKKSAKQNTHRRRLTAKTERVDLYQHVTDTIIAQLEQGTVPWVQPWDMSESNAAIALPKNAHSQRPYSGINILLLWNAAALSGHASHIWLTFKQALALGGCVRKGERGTTVFYADQFMPKGDESPQGENEADKQPVRFLKRYTVFNIAQCDRLPEGLFEAKPVSEARETHGPAEALIAATGADFRVGGDEAYYAPAHDYIRVPDHSAYFDPIDYYRTCFHELGHWTGHKARLDRKFAVTRRSAAYAREELTAELAAAFVCASLTIEPTVRHADYIGSWLRLLKDDKRAIFRAASLASKAANFILAFAPSDQ